MISIYQSPLLRQTFSQLSNLIDAASLTSDFSYIYLPGFYFYETLFGKQHLKLSRRLIIIST